MQTTYNGYTLDLLKPTIDILTNYQSSYNPKFTQVFRALELTPFNKVKVVILGQDPYPNPDDACGLSFSVNRDTKLPKSLINIFQLLSINLGIDRTNGDLSDWAKQGILLLNTILTFDTNNPTAHQQIGWQHTTDTIIKQLSNRGQCIFVLLGKHAQAKQSLIDNEHNIIISTVHPSPLSAYRGFFDSQLFIKINEALMTYDYDPINW